MLSDMIKILRLEFRYFRWLYSVALIATLGFGIAYNLTGTYRAILETGTLIQIVLIVSISISTGMDKRVRLLLLRPVEKRAIGWTYGFHIVFSGLVLLVIWILLATFGSETPPMIFNLDLILVLILRFLVNTAIFLMFAIAFDIIERNLFMGFILVTFFGFVVGFMAALFLDTLFSPEVLLVDDPDRVGRYFQLDLAMLLVVALLYTANAIILLRRKGYLK